MKKKYEKYLRNQIGLNKNKRISFFGNDDLTGRGSTYLSLEEKAFDVKFSTPILFENNNEIILEKQFCISELSFGHEISHPKTLQVLKDFSSDEWFIKDYDLNDLDSVINSLKNKSKEIPKFLNVENLTKLNGIQKKEYDVIYQYFLNNRNSPFWEVKNKAGTLVITTKLALAINLEYNKSPQVKAIRERIETGRLPLGKEILEFDKVLKESVDYLKSPNSKELFDFAESLTKKFEPEP